jgi:glucosamine-6-phosphate deaminase
MRIIIKEDYEAVSQTVADYIKDRIIKFNPTPEKPFVLGLPTGSSPLGTYKKLIEYYKKGFKKYLLR